MAGFSGYLHAADGAALDQRLDALAARSVPTIRVPKNSAAPMRAGRWRAVRPRWPASAGQATAQPLTERNNAAIAAAAVIHVVAEQATLDGTSDQPGYLPGFGILPAESVRDLAATAKLQPLEVPTTTTPEPGYRPSVKTMEFIRWRDLTCRWPGCDRPVHKCDVDHTVPYPFGATHASDLKHYCRLHHLIKTFYTGPGGWTDRQLPRGTIILTSPTGHTYVTDPMAPACFPHWRNPPARYRYRPSTSPAGIAM